MKFTPRSIPGLLTACLLVLTVAGCSSRGLSENQANQPRAAFDDCVSTVSNLAYEATTPAQYHLTAKQALVCVEQAPLMAGQDGTTPVMRIYALGIAHFLRSGELSRAQLELGRFKERFQGSDLRLAGGASFVDTVELMLGEATPDQAARDSLVNATPALKSEIRRQQYWQLN